MACHAGHIALGPMVTPRTLVLVTSVLHSRGRSLPSVFEERNLIRIRHIVVTNALSSLKGCSQGQRTCWEKVRNITAFERRMSALSNVLELVQVEGRGLFCAPLSRSLLWVLGTSDIKILEGQMKPSRCHWCSWCNRGLLRACRLEEGPMCVKGH